MTETPITPLQPMFKDSPTSLGRLLPAGKAAYLGLRSAFCDLREFFAELAEKSWSGHLYATVEGLRAHLLFFEGQAMAAVCRDEEGTAALAAFEKMWTDGATLSGFRLEPEIASALTGVRMGPREGVPGMGFSGTWVQAAQVELWQEGKVTARMPLPSSALGIYPAALTGRSLALTQPVAEWMRHHYTLTLRGRDGLSAITPLHTALKREVGVLGLSLMEQIRSGQSLMEFSQTRALSEHDLEKIVRHLVSGGYLHLEAHH
jgi:hypothetical protein